VLEPVPHRRTVYRKTLWKSSATLLLASITLSACSTFNDWLEGKNPEEPPAATVDTNESASYLEELYRQASCDPATQAEIHADARAAARLTPDTASRLRYALVLATPSHPSSDPEEAQSLLRDILAQPLLLTSAEKSLATIWLADVEARLVLRAEARRLRNQQARTANTENAAIAERVATVEAENRQLRQALSEAEQKLEAITSIERSIREQADENGTKQ
jgi:hypothetical protein